MTNHDIANTRAYELIEAMVVKTRRAKFLSGGLLAGMSSLLVAAPFLIGGGFTERAFIGGLGLVGAATGAFYVFQGMQLLDPKRSELVRTLVERPQRVVWVYEHVLRVNGVPNNSVLLYCDDGKKLALHLRQIDPAPLLDALQELVPHAMFGYSDKRRQAYKRDPSSFLTAA